MERRPLSPCRIRGLLETETTGCLSISRGDLPPHSVPVHFVLMEENLFIHCRPGGEKFRLAKEGRQAAFTLWRQERIVPHPDGFPCRTNTAYQSVLVSGQLEVVEDPGLRRRALEAIAAKYTPHLKGIPLPQAAVERTAVLVLRIDQLSGIANEEASSPA